MTALYNVLEDVHEQKDSGLGLAITKELIEMHKGKIAVDSEEGKVTRFTFFLPK